MTREKERSTEFIKPYKQNFKQKFRIFFSVILQIVDNLVEFFKIKTDLWTVIWYELCTSLS